MSGLERDGTAEPVSRDYILRRERGTGDREAGKHDWKKHTWLMPSR